MEEWKIEKFRSSHCARASLPLLCLCFTGGGAVIGLTSAELVCVAVHWLSQPSRWSHAECGTLPSGPAFSSGPGRCRRPQFVVRKHFSSPCRPGRDHSAAGVLSADSTESLFPSGVFHSWLQMLFWNTWNSNILAKFT